MKASDYVYIRAWSEIMGSREYWIQEQQELAVSESAPLDAVFRSQEGTWIRVGAVTSEDRKNRLVYRAWELRGGQVSGE